MIYLNARPHIISFEQEAKINIESKIFGLIRNQFNYDTFLKTTKLGRSSFSILYSVGLWKNNKYWCNKN